ncbi:hypothetical protein CW713_03275 [Methanophagales archaeon]|nr:MAG: hypothetical protein CW713_03275 [Methanophagales archaeon]
MASILYIRFIYSSFWFFIPNGCLIKYYRHARIPTFWYCRSIPFPGFYGFYLRCHRFFEYCALKALKFAGGSGIKLFLFFYTVVSCLTIVTSNDIMILTMTPFIYYSTVRAKINPVPFLIAEFFAANTWSMMLLIGNPTNMIVAESFRLEFIDYSRWMICPAMAGGIVNYIILRWIFRKDINKEYSLEFEEREISIFAICYFFLLGICLTCLAFASSKAQPLWKVSLAFAIFSFWIMLFSSFFTQENKIKGRISIIERLKESGTVIALKNLIPMLRIAPFILSLLILVEALKEHGIIDFIALTLFHAIDNNPLMGVLVMGFGSTFACNLFNNIPMTVTFVKILQNPLFMGMPNIESLRYALCMGSNLGANITPIGALAGIMWLSILHSKGREEIDVKEITKKFIKYGIITTILVTLISSLVLAAEVWMGW